MEQNGLWLKVTDIVAGDSPKAVQLCFRRNFVVQAAGPHARRLPWPIPSSHLSPALMRSGQPQLHPQLDTNPNLYQKLETSAIKMHVPNVATI